MARAASFGVPGASAKPATTRWRWNLSGYVERLRNEVFSVDNPNAPGIKLHHQHSARRLHAGIEAQAGASLASASGNHLDPLVATASWNDFAFRHDPHYGNRRLPSAPRYALHAELIWHTPVGYYLRPHVRRHEPRYADFANSYRVGSYALFGLHRVGGFGGQVFRNFMPKPTAASPIAATPPASACSTTSPPRRRVEPRRAAAGC